jgi:hypothetical protein
MTQGRLAGSPFEGLEQDDLFEPVESRGPDLVAEYARSLPRFMCVNLGPLPRDPFAALDAFDEEFGGEGRYYRGMAAPPTQAEVESALRGLAALLAGTLQENPEGRAGTIEWLEKNGGRTPGPQARLIAALKGRF